MSYPTPVYSGDKCTFLYGRSFATMGYVYGNLP